MPIVWELRQNFSLLLTMLAVSAPFLIALAIVYYFRFRSAVAGRRNAVSNATELETAGLKREVRELRERVQVLEAIVTDRKHELSRKIANL